MEVVKKISLVPQYQLSGRIKRLLFDQYIYKKTLSTLDENELKIALRAIYNFCWIKCDCTQGTDKLPLLSLRKVTGKEGAKFFIARMTKRTSHHSACPFYSEPLNETEKKLRSPATKRWNLAKPLNLHSDADPGTLSTKKASASSTASRETDELSNWNIARAIFTLLDESKSNVIDIEALALNKLYWPFYGTQFAEIRDKIATKLMLADKQPMKDFFYTSPNQLKLASFHLDNTNYRWKNLVIPYAMFLLRVARFNGNTVTCLDPKKNETDLTLQGTFKVSSGFLTNHSAPFVLLATCPKTEETNISHYSLNHGFLLPVLSSACLMPVESSHERRVLKQLINTGHGLFKKHGMPVKIIKPLFALGSLKDNNHCRPDFIIENKNKSLIIEVMGFDDPDYIDRKFRLLPAMQKHGCVLEFSAIEADKNRDWNARLEMLSKQIIDYFLIK